MAKDISEELYAKIKASFDAKYEKAQLLGEPLHDVFERIRNGSANFREADMYAVEVGSMLSDSMKEHLILDKMPNKTFYRNIAKKTVGTGLKDGYGLVSNITSVIQEEMNVAAGIGLKPVKPKLDVRAVDDIVNRASAAKTQEELDGVLTEPVKTFTRRVADDSMKANARLHNRAGLEVKVEREYDNVGLHDGTDVCDFCTKRADTWTYDKAMANGVFERHEGCGCIITYTSKKGEVTRSTGKNSGFSKIENPQEHENKIKNTEKNTKKQDKKELPKYAGNAIIKTDNQSVREWYYANVHDIPNQLDYSKPFEEQVRQAFELRNKYKREARFAMSDVSTVKELEETRPVPTFDELLKKKMEKKGLSREKALQDILHTASTTNTDVDKEFGLG